MNTTRIILAAALGLALLSAPPAHAVAADSSNADTLSAHDAVEQLRREMNTALAELAGKLNEARSKQSQSSVDGLMYARWSDDVQQHPGFNQFELDRAYVNVRGSLGHRGAYRVTADFGRTSGERQFGFLKFAYGSVALHRAATVSMGLIPPPVFEYQEGIWKYRFVAKMMLDEEKKMSTSDLGVAAEGLLGTRASYKVLLSNGESFSKPEVDRAKDLTGRFTVTVRPGLRVSAFGNYGLIDTSAVRAPALVRHRYGANLSYEQPTYMLYAEAAAGEDQSRTSAPHTQFGGLSAGTWVAVHGDWKLFGRVDRYDPNRRFDDDAHTRGIAGVSYTWSPNMILALDHQWVAYGAAARTANSGIISLHTQVTF